MPAGGMAHPSCLSTSVLQLFHCCRAFPGFNEHQAGLPPGSSLVPSNRESIALKSLLISYMHH